jgi:hypothetical protein
MDLLLFLPDFSCSFLFAFLSHLLKFTIGFIFSLLLLLLHSFIHGQYLYNISTHTHRSISPLTNMPPLPNASSFSPFCSFPFHFGFTSQLLPSPSLLLALPFASSFNIDFAKYSSPLAGMGEGRGGE